MLAVHIESGKVVLRDFAPPQRRPGFALIRLVCGGICNTDLELQRGYYGFSGTPGHEFVGEVVEADDRALIGKVVVGEINLNCGDCRWCQRGLGRHCPHRTVLGIVKHPGAFQECFTLPERNLFVVPESIPPDAAVFTEPLAAACEILDQVALPCGACIAVLGDGKLGLLIALVLNAYGFRVHQFGRHAEKLKIAERAGIVTQIANEAVPEAEYEWVVEATGRQQGLATALRMVRPRGTVVLKSTLHGMAEVNTAAVIVHEITLLGSRCGRFEPALELLRLGSVDVTPLISESHALSDAPHAFMRAATPGVLKVLLHAPSR